MFTVQKWRWVLLQDEDLIPPVYPAEVVVQATTSTGRPEKPWEMVLEQLYGDQEAHLIEEREVFRLTD